MLIVTNVIISNVKLDFHKSTNVMSGILYFASRVGMNKRVISFYKLWTFRTY